MFRVCIFLSVLSAAACISYPEVTLVDETRDASVSPYGSAETIALDEDLDVDTSVDASIDVKDGGVLPHPERDARAEEPTDDAGGDDDPGNGNGKGKGKPPKKKD